jgi:nucleotidyltransferase AbiEii toxin of type IV toxin-antitoxin system
VLAMDFDVLKRVLAALEARRVRYVIFGAVALNLHGLARSTEDLDLFVDPEESNIELLKLALKDAIDDPEIEQIAAADLLGPYPAVQYFPPGGAFHIDILTRLGDAFHFSDLETERVPYEDLLVTVVTPAMLYRMKRDTVRPRDRSDAIALRERFKLEE